MQKVWVVISVTEGAYPIVSVIGVFRSKEAADAAAEAHVAEEWETVSVSEETIQ